MAGSFPGIITVYAAIELYNDGAFAKTMMQYE